MTYTLRCLETYDDYHACERLQQHAWRFSDPLDVIPLTNLVTAQKWGGLVLGAFDEGGELHGFCYGFLGRDPEGRLVHCSHSWRLMNGHEIWGSELASNGHSETMS